MGNILVLNMGLKSIRSIIFDYNGNKLGSAAMPLETAIMGDRVTQDPADWWSGAIKVIKESLRGVDLRVDYLTVTASSSCLVCVDEHGIELEKAIMVSDKRATEQSIALSLNNDFAAVAESTGLGADPYLMLPKILWVKDHQPEVFARTCKFLSPDDYLLGRITGLYVTDYFNAQKYHYDIMTKKYPTVLLNALGIDPNCFPEVVGPGTEIGLVKAEVAELLGLGKRATAVVTTYDAICSFFGSGVAKEGDASDVSGTVTTFRVLSKKNGIIASSKVFNQPFVDRGINIVGGSNNLGGGLIEWVKQCYYQNEQYPYEVMEKEARESSVGAGGLIFLPYLLGERAPIWDVDARGVFFGLERVHTRKDMTRAVFESTGFVLMDMIKAIEETGVEIESIRTSGGLARINFISQLKADISGKDILVLDEFETTALGAAMLLLIGIGAAAEQVDVAEKFVTVRMIVKPNRRNYLKYVKLHGLYNETYKSLKELFKERKLLVDSLYDGKEERIANL